MVNIVLLLFLWAAFQAAQAQSVHQLGVSAAGGSAAGIAGKGVSDGLNSVGGVLGKAAKTGDKEKKKGRLAPFVPPEPSLPTAKKKPADLSPDAMLAEAPAQPGRSVTPRTRPDAASPVRRLADAPVPVRTAAQPSAKPEPIRISVELPQLEVGTSRSDVVERLGRPAGRITSVEDQGLVEVYSFREGRTPVGSVRLVNGRVAEVKVLQ